MLVQELFEQFLRKLGLGINSPIVLGVSGGLDSMVLLYLCWRARLRVVVGHVNYQLRGLESENDARLVARYAAKYDYQIVEKVANLQDMSKQKSIENEARILRYQFLEDLRKQHTCMAIFTAHHADDNVETALLNFLRPTGLLGLAAMPYKNGYILRPLLNCKKAELYAFASKQNIEFREDRTNSENQYLRNFLRNKILPDLSKKIPNLYTIISENIRHYQETYMIYQAHVTKMRDKYLREQNGILIVSLGVLSNLKPLRTWIYELFRPFIDNARQVDAILQLLQAGSGKYLRMRKYDILRHRAELQIIPRAQNVQNKDIYPLLINDLPFTNSIANHALISLELVKNIPNMQEFIYTLKAQNDQRTIYLDAKELQFPLLLRPLRHGDYYYPLGLGKKKKVLRLAMEAKMNRFERLKIWVLEAANGHIVWVYGLRPDDRYQLRLSSETVLKIKLDLSLVN